MWHLCLGLLELSEQGNFNPKIIKFAVLTSSDHRNPPTMPFFRTKKDKMLKDKSKSSLDLFTNFDSKDSETKKELKRKSGSTFNLFTPPKSPNLPPKSQPHNPPDVVAILTKAHKNKSKSLFHLHHGMKSKSKSSLSLFDNNNNNMNNNVNNYGNANTNSTSNLNDNLSYFKEKVRSSTAVVPFRKVSASSLKMEDDNRCRADEAFMNSNGNSSPPRNSVMRKHSQSSTDSMDNGRDRRLHDIAQLDSYIDYLRRSEDCSMSNVYNRLCCAQVLRLVLLRQQHMHDNEALHSARSHEKLDNHHSPLGGSPEIQHKPLPFTRRGSTRKFKRPAPGLVGGKLPLERIDSGAMAETNMAASQQFVDVSSGSDESLFRGRWDSTSSINLVSNSSENGLSSDSAPDSDDGYSNHQRKSCGQKFTVATFPSDIEIY